MFKTSLLTLAGLLVSLAVHAAPDITILQQALQGQEPDSIAETPVPGLYEIVVGAQVYYLSEDGVYLFQGDLIQLDNRENLTEVRRNTMRAEAIDAVDEGEMVVFSPDTPAQHTVTVFTDIDCGYCRKLHQEIDSYLDAGIAVRYLAFPRAGINSESYNKAVSVWCADDPQEAMTQAKAGEAVEPRACDNPVAAQYRLGETLGVRGTPSIILDSGQMVPGYVPADRLSQILSTDPSLN